MVVSFSGTGNSQYCARLLAERLGDETVDSFPFIRSKKTAALSSEKPWVFVSPTYAWRLPRIFEEFIRNGQFSGSREAWFIMTCGSEIGAPDPYIQALCREESLVFRGVLPVVMPENYIAMFQAPQEAEARQIVAAARPTLEEAAWSDVIVRVADAGDDQREEQLAVTDEVLDGLDCADIPRLTVYNKCDKPNALNFDPDILLTSAKTGYGLDALLKSWTSCSVTGCTPSGCCCPMISWAWPPPCGSGAACSWRSTGRTGFIWKASSKPRTCTVLRVISCDQVSVTAAAGSHPSGWFPKELPSLL